MPRTRTKSLVTYASVHRAHCFSDIGSILLAAPETVQALTRKIKGPFRWQVVPSESAC